MAKTTLQKIYTVFRLAKELYGPIKSKIFVLASLGFVNGFLGVVGVGALIPLFSVLLKKETEGENLAIKISEYIFTKLNLPLTISLLLTFVVIFFLLKAGALFSFKYLGMSIVTEYERDLRIALWRGVLFSSWPALSSQKLGHAENTLMVDVSASSALLRILISFLHSMTSMVMYAAAAFALFPGVTALTIFGSGIILFLSKPLLARVRGYARKETNLKKRVAHEINENAVGMKMVKAIRIEEPLARVGASLFDGLRNARMRAGVINAFVTVLIQPITVIYVAVFFALSYQKPSFDIPVFVAVLYLIQQMFTFFEKAQHALHGMNQEIPYVQNVIRIQKEIDECHEDLSGHLPFSFQREISFDHVRFQYDSVSVLSDVSFSVQRGEMIGIVGESGAGKTTIADLLLRLFQPQEGVIRIDNLPIDQIRLDEWRRRVGYVSQDMFFKNITVRENILFYDDAISEDRMQNAARVAHIFHVIEKLPKGFDTIVGERGTKFSVGQRQRIALARALARDPDILVLDEATSALDNKSESMIQRAIEGLRGKKTIFVIAHRLSTVMHCDRVIVLDQGRIVEDGRPGELLADKNSRFSQLSRIQ